MLISTGSLAGGPIASMRPEAGIGVGVALAIAISWSANKSILWTLAHGLMSWFYDSYYVPGPISRLTKAFRTRNPKTDTVKHGPRCLNIWTKALATRDESPFDYR